MNASFFTAVSNALTLARKRVNDEKESQEVIFETNAFNTPLHLAAQNAIHQALHRLTYTRTYWCFYAIKRMQTLRWMVDEHPKYGVKPPMKYTQGRHLLSLSTIIEGHYYNWKLDFQADHDFPQRLQSNEHVYHLLENMAKRLGEYEGWVKHRHEMHQQYLARKHGGHAQNASMPKNLQRLLQSIDAWCSAVDAVQTRLNNGEHMPYNNTVRPLAWRFQENMHDAQGGNVHLPEEDSDVSYNPEQRVYYTMDDPQTGARVEVFKHFAYRRQYGVHCPMENAKTIAFINKMIPTAGGGWYEVIVTQGGQTYKVELTPWERPSTTFVRPFCFVAEDSPMQTGQLDDPPYLFRDQPATKYKTPFYPEPYLIHGKGNEMDGIVHSLRVIHSLSTRPETQHVFRNINAFLNGPLLYSMLLQFARAYYSTDDARAGNLGCFGDRSVFFLNVQGCVVGVEMYSPSLPPYVNYLKHSHVPQLGPRQPPQQQQRNGSWTIQPTPHYQVHHNHHAHHVMPPPPSLPPQQQPRDAEMRDFMDRMEQRIQDLMDRVFQGRAAVQQDPGAAAAVLQDVQNQVQQVEVAIQNHQINPPPVAPPPPQVQVQPQPQQPQQRTQHAHAQNAASPAQPPAGRQSAWGNSQNSAESWDNRALMRPHPMETEKQVLQKQDPTNGNGITVAENKPHDVYKEIMVWGLPHPDPAMQYAEVERQDALTYKLDTEMYRRTGAYLYVHETTGSSVFQGILNEEGMDEKEYAWKIKYPDGKQQLTKVHNKNVLEGQSLYGCNEALIQATDMGSYSVHVIPTRTGGDTLAHYVDNKYKKGELVTFTRRTGQNAYEPQSHNRHLNVRLDGTALKHGPGRERYYLRMFLPYNPLPFNDKSGKLPYFITMHINLAYRSEQGNIEIMDASVHFVLVDSTTPEYMARHKQVPLNHGEPVKHYTLVITKYYDKQNQGYTWGLKCNTNDADPVFIAHKRLPSSPALCMTDDKHWVFTKNFDCDEIQTQGQESMVTVETMYDTSQVWYKRQHNQQSSEPMTEEDRLEEQDGLVMAPTADLILHQFHAVDRDAIQKAYDLEEHLRSRGMTGRFKLHVFGQDQLLKLNQENTGAKIKPGIGFVPSKLRMEQEYLRDDGRDSTFELVYLQGPVYMSWSGRFMIAPHVYRGRSDTDSMVTWGVYEWDRTTARYEIFAAKISGQRSYLVNDPTVQYEHQKDNHWLFYRSFKGNSYNMKLEKNWQPSEMDICLVKDTQARDNPYRLKKRYFDFTVSNHEQDARGIQVDQARMRAMAEILTHPGAKLGSKDEADYRSRHWADEMQDEEEESEQEIQEEEEEEFEPEIPKDEMDDPSSNTYIAPSNEETPEVQQGNNGGADEQGGDQTEETQVERTAKNEEEPENAKENNDEFSFRPPKIPEKKKYTLDDMRKDLEKAADKNKSKSDFFEETMAKHRSQRARGTGRPGLYEGERDEIKVDHQNKDVYWKTDTGIPQYSSDEESLPYTDEIPEQQAAEGGDSSQTRYKYSAYDYQLPNPVYSSIPDRKISSTHTTFASENLVPQYRLYTPWYSIMEDALAAKHVLSTQQREAARGGQQQSWGGQRNSFQPQRREQGGGYQQQQRYARGPTDGNSRWDTHKWVNFRDQGAASSAHSKAPAAAGAGQQREEVKKDQAVEPETKTESKEEKTKEDKEKEMEKVKKKMEIELGIMELNDEDLHKEMNERLLNETSVKSKKDKDMDDDPFYFYADIQTGDEVHEYFFKLTQPYLREYEGTGVRDKSIPKLRLVPVETYGFKTKDEKTISLFTWHLVQLSKGYEQVLAIKNDMPQILFDQCEWKNTYRKGDPIIEQYSTEWRWKNNKWFLKDSDFDGERHDEHIFYQKISFYNSQYHSFYDDRVSFNDVPVYKLKGFERKQQEVDVSTRRRLYSWFPDPRHFDYVITNTIMRGIWDDEILGRQIEKISECPYQLSMFLGEKSHSYFNYHFFTHIENGKKEFNKNFLINRTDLKKETGPSWISDRIKEEGVDQDTFFNLVIRFQDNTWSVFYKLNGGKEEHLFLSKKVRENGMYTPLIESHKNEFWNLHEKPDEKFPKIIDHFREQHILRHPLGGYSFTLKDDPKYGYELTDNATLYSGNASNWFIRAKIPPAPARPAASDPEDHMLRQCFEEPAADRSARLPLQPRKQAAAAAPLRTFAAWQPPRGPGRGWGGW